MLGSQNSACSDKYKEEQRWRPATQGRTDPLRRQPGPADRWARTTARRWTSARSASASWPGRRRPAAAFSLVEHPIPPKTLVAPVHIHEREDEYSFVLEGRMGAKLGDDVVYAEVGDLAFKPRNQWHTFWNPDDTPCRILEIIAPGGFEHFFEEMASSDGRRVRPARSWRSSAPTTGSTSSPRPSPSSAPSTVSRTRCWSSEGLRDRISTYAGSGGGSARPQASTPPSTRIVVPVMNAPPGLARNATVSPTSAAVPSRPSGTVRRRLLE